MLRTIRVTRYVTPLREGGSLPALVEAEDDGLYVLKFRGAGQGPLALVAELIAGEIGRALALPVPEIVFLELPEAIGRNEADPEIRDLVMASVGLNIGLDFLPGSIMFDPAAGDTAEATLASQIVWFDALVSNIDRTARNANLLLWHTQPYLIDHGASLFFQHNWQPVEAMALRPFRAIREHILLPWASRISEVDAGLRERLPEATMDAILQQVPASWLPEPSDGTGPSIEGYRDYFRLRLQYGGFVQEALEARALLV